MIQPYRILFIGDSIYLRAIESSLTHLTDFEVFYLDSDNEDLSSAILNLAPHALVIADPERIPEATQVVAANPGVVLLIFDPDDGKLSAAEYRDYPARTQNDVIHTLHSIFENQDCQLAPDISTPKLTQSDTKDTPC
jgi:hypothetical protein